MASESVAGTLPPTLPVWSLVNAEAGGAASLPVIQPTSSVPLDWSCSSDAPPSEPTFDTCLVCATNCFAKPAAAASSPARCAVSALASRELSEVLAAGVTPPLSVAAASWSLTSLNVTQLSYVWPLVHWIALRIIERNQLSMAYTQLWPSTVV